MLVSGGSDNGRGEGGMGEKGGDLENRSLPSNRCDFIHSSPRELSGYYTGISYISGECSRFYFSRSLHSLDQSLLCLRSARINRKREYIWKGI